MKYIILVFSLILSLQVFSQKSEYQYFSIRLGYNQGFSSQPGFNANKYLKTPLGEMQLTPVESNLGYMPGFVADIYYHFDFASNAAGIMFGLEYNNYGVSSKYETVNGAYTMVEKHRINAIGIPIVFKMGPKFYKKQSYAFIGGQYNYNISMNEIQSVSWNKTPSSSSVSDALNNTSMAFFAGYNWMVMNIQFEYVPGSFFNKEYISPEDVNIMPYSTQTDNMFYIKLSFHTPTNDWLGSKNYKLKRFLRKIKFW